MAGARDRVECMRHPFIRIMTAFALALLVAILFTGCSRDAQAMDARQIEQQYGVAGAYTDTIATSHGRKKGAAVGATAGEIGGLIYDLATRNKK